jgi:hypothetical protein
MIIISKLTDMKRFFFAFSAMVLITVFFFISCKKDKDETPAYTCATCIGTPEAKAVNDASTKGIYKGTIIGSSGTIRFDIANDGSAIKAIMVIDGTTVNLTSNVTWVAGQPYVAPFSGTLNGQTVTISFSVGLSGANPTVTSTSIPGHPNAVIAVVKETSSSLVECFEGTIKSSDNKSGTFNMIVARSLGKWWAVVRENGGTAVDDKSGTIDSGGKFYDDDNRHVAALSGDVISGSFKTSDGITLTIYGKRTL